MFEGASPWRIHQCRQDGPGAEAVELRAAWIGGVAIWLNDNLSQLKSGGTSAPRLPQTLQTNRGWRSDSHMSGARGHRVRATIVSPVDQEVADVALFREHRQFHG
jgi:hypothetical protein